MSTSLTLPTIDRYWSLLDRLKVSLVALLAADAFFLLIIIWAAHVQYNVVKTIGKDSAPGVISAQDIKVELADMDAEAANEMLVAPGQEADAAQGFDTHRQKVGEELINAAHDITSSDTDEDASIKRLQFGLGEYEAHIQRARDFHERKDPQAIQLYREATFKMENTLFQAADSLDAINFTQLENAYQKDRSDATLLRTAVTAVGLAFLGLLLWIQWDLTQRVRRMLNPALACGTVLALALLSFSYAHLSGSAKDLRVAKEDAFDSLHVLWQARAFAFAANADESKYFLEGTSHADEKSFDARAYKILSYSNRPSERGFLEKEMANITFDGEREAAQETIDAWTYYRKLDWSIRQLKQSGKIDAAIALCLGKDKGQSDWAFNQFDTALMRTIAINQEAFVKSRDSAFHQLDSLVEIAAIGAAAIAICCSLGLFIRIREFL
jgi:hypothetical protein